MKPPELLISVRDLDEAAVAVSLGVAIVDFKDPARGPLAATDPALWHEADQRWPDAQLSAALGETGDAIALAPQVPPAFRYAKIGPSGHAATESLRSVWRSASLPASVSLVPVAYADHSLADSPPVADVLEAVIAEGHFFWLIDTFGKDGTTLLDHLSHAELRLLLDRATSAGIATTLAGSITLNTAISCHDQGILPKCWGVRGDVCQVNDSTRQRQGTLDPARVVSWQTILDPRQSDVSTARSVLPPL